MTVAYLDCEFNGYKGDLISLALVIDDKTISTKYWVVLILFHGWQRM